MLIDLQKSPYQNEDHWLLIGAIEACKVPQMLNYTLCLGFFFFPFKIEDFRKLQNSAFYLSLIT